MAKLVEEKKDACLSCESHKESIRLEAEVLSLCSQDGKTNCVQVPACETSLHLRAGVGELRTL